MIFNKLFYLGTGTCRKYGLSLRFRLKMKHFVKIVKLHGFFLGELSRLSYPKRLIFNNGIFVRNYTRYFLYLSNTIEKSVDVNLYFTLFVLISSHIVKGFSRSLRKRTSIFFKEKKLVFTCVRDKRT